MNTEIFWKQLKHHYLQHLLWPRLDQLVWILSTQVVPNYMAHASYLEDTSRFSRSKTMTPFQKGFKSEWQRLTKLESSARIYEIDVSKWSCTCPSLKYNPFHLCKHLVNAVLPPSDLFFTQVIRRRTQPLYKHPALYPKGTPSPLNFDGPDDGSITDGDDHVWLGDASSFSSGCWRELISDPSVSLGKRKASVYSQASSDCKNNVDIMSYCTNDIGGIEDVADSKSVGVRGRLRRRTGVAEAE